MPKPAKMRENEDDRTTGVRRSRPTMKDVAARAGVSPQTVSNVINDRVGATGPKTRARVEEAMRSLGYHMNVSARALRSSRADAFALLLRDETQSFLADPLTNLITAGIGDVLRERERGLLIQTSKATDRGIGLLRPVLEGRVDGAFVLLSGDRELRMWYIDRLKENDRPFVVFDEVLDDPTILSVRAADRDAGRMLTEYLLNTGHRRIAFVGARSPWAVVEQRLLGYHDALNAAGVPSPAEIRLFDAGWKSDGGADMTTRLLALKEPPTAIMCGSDVLAVGAVQAAKALGRQVPGDVAITGFDDFDFSSYVEPALTTVRVPGYEMGQVAARMLIDEVDGNDPSPRQFVLPVELRLRATA